MPTPKKKSQNSKATPSSREDKEDCEDLFNISFDVANIDSLIENNICDSKDKTLVPRWVYELKKLENDQQEIDKAIAGKKPPDEIVIQKLSEYLLNGLIADSFKGSLKDKFSVNFESKGQLRYDEFENAESNYLPTNFNNSSNGKADIAILLVDANTPEMFRFPIFIGELKTNINWGEDPDYLQLFNYQLTVQRPYKVDAAGSGPAHLIGFLMDFEFAYVFEFAVGNWTDFEPVPSDLINVRKYKFDRKSSNPTFRVQCYRFFSVLLDDLKSKLLTLTADEFDKIRAPRSPTLRFPIEPHLPGDLFPSFILPLTKNQWENDLRPIFSSRTTDRTWLQLNGEIESLGANDILVLKVFGSLLSGGLSVQNQLCNFLRTCEDIPLDINSTLRRLIVDRLYIGVYSILNRVGIRFSLTRFIDGEKCSSERFVEWWQTNRDRAAAAFLRYVFKPAFEAIERGFFHWDIRAANLMCDCENSEFYILDWESLVDADDAKQIRGHYTDTAKTLGKRVSYRMKVVLSLCEKLLDSCIYVWDRRKDESTTKIAGDFFKQFNISKNIMYYNTLDLNECEPFFLSLMSHCIRISLDQPTVTASGDSQHSVSQQLPPITSVPKNSDVSMDCKFTLSIAPHSRVAWLWNGVPVNENRVRIVSHPPAPLHNANINASDQQLVHRFTLSISGVQRTDEGIYCCSLQLDAKTDSAAAGEHANSILLQLSTSTVLRVEPPTECTASSSSSSKPAPTTSTRQQRSEQHKRSFSSSGISASGEASSSVASTRPKRKGKNK